MKKTPTPGIHAAVPFDEYLQWDAVSNSRLSLLKRSPKHFRHGFGEETEAMRFGTLTHSGVLEPLSIALRYAVMPDYTSHPDNVTKTGARSFSRTDFVRLKEEAFTRLHFDKQIVTRKQYDDMVGIASAIAECHEAKALLRDGQSELSVVWEDRCGLLCKCRIDWLQLGCMRMIDLKTTADAMRFDKAIANYGYHRQMAFYLRGLGAHGLGDITPWIVAVEKDAPFGCRAAPMSEDALSVGCREIDELLSQLVDCHMSGEWPGYQSPGLWSLPTWYGGEDTVELIVGGESLRV